MPKTGKTSLCKNLAKDLNLVHIKVSHIIREFMKNPFSLTAQTLINTTALLRAFLLKPNLTWHLDVFNSYVDELGLISSYDLSTSLEVDESPSHRKKWSRTCWQLINRKKCVKNWSNVEAKSP